MWLQTRSSEHFTEGSRAPHVEFSDLQRGYTPYNRVYSSGSRVTPPDDGPGDRRELSREARRSDFGEIVFASRVGAYEVWLK